MKYNSIGEQLIAKARELDPNYKPDKFNDMSEALDVILNNSGGKGLNILSLNLKDCMNESDYNELVGYILQKTVIAKSYNITLPDLTGVDIVKFTVETPIGNISTIFYRNSKTITQFNWLYNWTDNENFMQMVTITGYTDNNVNYIKYNGINSGGGSQLDYLYFETILDDEGTPSFTYTLEQYNEMIKSKPIILKIEGLYYNTSVNINEDTKNYEITITKSQNLGPEFLYANTLITMNGVLSSSTLKTILHIVKGDMIVYSVSTNSSNNNSYVDITYQDAINGGGGNGSLMPDYTLGNNNQVMTIVNGYPEWADINMRTISLFGKHPILVPNDSADTNILPLPSDASTSTYVLKAVNGVVQWVKES